MSDSKVSKTVTGENLSGDRLDSGGSLKINDIVNPKELEKLSDEEIVITPETVVSEIIETAEEVVEQVIETIEDAIETIIPTENEAKQASGEQEKILDEAEEKPKTVTPAGTFISKVRHWLFEEHI